MEDITVRVSVSDWECREAIAVRNSFKKKNRKDKMMQQKDSSMEASEAGGKCQMLNRNKVPKVSLTLLSKRMVFADVASCRNRNVSHQVQSNLVAYVFFFLLLLLLLLLPFSVKKWAKSTDWWRQLRAWASIVASDTQHSTSSGRVVCLWVGLPGTTTYILQSGHIKETVK